MKAASSACVIGLGFAAKSAGSVGERFDWWPVLIASCGGDDVGRVASSHYRLIALGSPRVVPWP